MSLYSFRNMNIELPQPIPLLASNNAVTENNPLELGTLYKHCKTMFLPRTGSTIRLGTIAEYRKNENRAVQDKDEGLFRVSLKFIEGTNVKVSKLKRLTLNTISLPSGYHDSNIATAVLPGSETTTSVYCITHDVFSNEPNTNRNPSNGPQDFINLKGTIDLMSEGADAHILSFSRSSQPNSVILDPEYDAVWSLSEPHTKSFADAIAAKLIELYWEKKVFNSETIGPFPAPGIAVPPMSDGFFFTVLWRRDVVTYRNKEIEVHEGFTDELISDVHECINQSAQIKPSIFAQEQEVRFIFRPAMIEKSTGYCFLFPHYLNEQFIPVESLLKFINKSS